MLLPIFWGGAVFADDICKQSAKPIKSCENQEILLIDSNGKNNYYCTLDTFAKEFETLENFTAILAKDYKTHTFFDAKNGFYLTNSKIGGGFSRYSKVAFKNEKDAIEFQGKYGGDVRRFDFALFMAGRDYDTHLASLEFKKELLRGKNIYEKICKKGDYPLDSPFEIAMFLKNEQICQGVDGLFLYSVSNYLSDKDRVSEAVNETIEVPKDAKCPVCGMFVHKYKKWAAKGVDNNDKVYFFDGAKDMFKYYFTYKESIKNLLVSDYYTLEPIDAKAAFFVIGSDVYGPMGHEFIPFKERKKAELFAKEHGGVKIIGFFEVNSDMPKKLDVGSFSSNTTF